MATPPPRRVTASVAPRRVDSTPVWPMSKPARRVHIADSVDPGTCLSSVCPSVLKLSRAALPHVTSNNLAMLMKEKTHRDLFLDRET
jgi:hypothetical protein